MKSILRTWPNLENLRKISHDVILGLPKNTRKFAKNIYISLDNFPDQDTLEHLKLCNRYDLLGLYRGVPLPQKSTCHRAAPDCIFLYRCPIIRYAIDTGESIANIVKNVILYEIQHHCGKTEAIWSE